MRTVIEASSAPRYPIFCWSRTTRFPASRWTTSRRRRTTFFKQHRDAYYDHLQRVRTEGAWEAWHEFFLEGVVSVASSATDTARKIRSLVDADRARIHALGRGAASAHRVHDLAGRRIVLSASRTADELQLSAPTVNAAFARLEDVGILHEVTGRKRGRLFVYSSYLQLLQAER